MLRSITSWQQHDEALERERARAAQAREREQRARLEALRELPDADFAARTKIKVPTGQGDEEVAVPFVLWSEQVRVLALMASTRLIAFLKARQLGVTWLVCLFAMRLCTFRRGQEVLFLSKGQNEANKLAERTSYLYHQHQNRADLPMLIKDGTQELAWDNGSRVSSLPATKDAGRSDTASLVVLDEWAFMKWPQETLAAIKPTIDAGGKLFIISSADGNGTAYHQLWQAAEAGQNGYLPVFLPWFARPERGPTWRDEKLAESNNDTATVYREYPANPIEAFTNAVGLIYDVWSDGPEGGNVTADADYVPGAGPVYWALDDGYAGMFNEATGMYTADSHPRCFLLVQEKGDGRLDVFYEDYKVQMLSDQHIERVQQASHEAGYPHPDYVAIDSAAAELRGRMHALGFYTQGKPHDVEESIKHLRRYLGTDANGWRRVRVHPRCTQVRKEMAAYRRDGKGKIIEAFDHGPSALRYFAWSKRYEG